MTLWYHNSHGVGMVKVFTLVRPFRSQPTGEMLLSFYSQLSIFTFFIVNLLDKFKNSHKLTFRGPISWNWIKEYSVSWLTSLRSTLHTEISHCHTPLFANHSSRHQTVAKASQLQLATFTWKRCDSGNSFSRITDWMLIEHIDIFTGHIQEERENSACASNQ